MQWVLWMYSDVKKTLCKPVKSKYSAMIQKLEPT